jgi:hypothetical protein
MAGIARNRARVPVLYGFYGAGVMSEYETRGGAGPALAAHSKDASAPGQTAASTTTGRNAPGGLARNGGSAESLSAMSCRAMDEGAAFIREQPFIAMAATGAICLAIGLMVARR